MKPETTKARRMQQTREEAARREIGETQIRPGLAAVLVLFFVAVIGGVPGLQTVVETRRTFDGERETYVPQAFDFFREMPSLHTPVPGERHPVAGIVEANRRLLRHIHTFEDQLEDESVFGQAIRPTAQYVMARWLGVGNEMAYIGRDRWLFFRPAVDHLTGPGFLDPRQWARRLDEGNEWRPAPQPDPRAAIRQFHAALAERDIRLVVMPVPVKASIHPERMSGRFAGGEAPLQNPSYRKFVEALRAEGILVFDVSELLIARKRMTGDPQFLAADTHWRPETVEYVAARLAEYLAPYLPRPSPAAARQARDGDGDSVESPALGRHPGDGRPGVGESGREAEARRAPGPSLRRQPVEVAARGDIAHLLKLPEGQTLFPPEPVTIRQVLADDGQWWQPSADADILVLGDSFSNIYSLEPLGWGESAGFVEQLSYEMRRPIDRLVRNDDGAHATRALLARELARGRDRLDGKRIVVWQFSARELSIGDWALMDMELRDVEPAEFFAPDPGEEVRVRGWVRDIAPAPRPGTVPYRDHVVSVHLVDLEHDDERIRGQQALVYMRSMEDNVWTPAARHRRGDRIEVRLRSWDDVADRYEAFHRSELDDWDVQLAPPAWGEPANGAMD